MGRVGRRKVGTVSDAALVRRFRLIPGPGSEYSSTPIYCSQQVPVRVSRAIACTLGRGSKKQEDMRA
jgi:hypothetical protein